MLDFLELQGPLPGLPDTLPDHVTAALPHSARAFDALTGGQVPEWRAGVAIPALDLLVVPIGEGRALLSPEGRRVLRHEWAHLGLHQYLGNARAPRWFDEGYAQYASGGWDATEAWRLRILLALGRTPPLDSLTLTWPRDRASAEAAYLLAASAVDYLLRGGGERGLAIFLRRWRDDGSFDTGFRRTFGVTTGQFEEDWRGWVKSRYGWLFVLTRSAVFWMLLALVLLLMARSPADQEPGAAGAPEGGRGTGPSRLLGGGGVPERNRDPSPGGRRPTMNERILDRRRRYRRPGGLPDPPRPRRLRGGDGRERGAGAGARRRPSTPSSIVTDVRMDGMSGLELLERLHEDMTDVDVVVMTGHEDMETAVTAMKAGAFDFLVKPVDPKALQALAERCFRERALARSMRWRRRTRKRRRPRERRRRVPAVEVRSWGRTPA